MEKLKAEGKCLYCKKHYSQSGIGRHLGAHLKKAEQENPSKTTAYHLKVTGGDLYFLHVLMHEKQLLYELDVFLKRIWLECCGHLSAFLIKGRNYTYSIDADFGEDMDSEIGKIFTKGMVLNYDYDYGSTTRLEVKVINEYQMKTSKEVVLLTRNEPLKLLCHTCNKLPAKQMCILWHEDGQIFCEDCVEEHKEACSDFADYAAMPLVNSPRTGVCGYDGGSIDTERDGPWEAEKNDN